MRQVLISILFCLIGFSSIGQVINIYELTDQNEQILVEKPFIVDINGTLRLKIDKSALLDSMAYQLDIKDFPREQLNAIHYALRLQQQTLNSIVATGSRDDRIKALEQFHLGMGGISRYLFMHQSELQGTQFYTDINAALEAAKSDKPDYKPFFQVLNNYYEQVTSQYATLVDKSSAKFKLGGWLNTNKGATQFHIEGFDSLAANGIVEVPRFVTSIPPEEAQAYNQARDLADSLKNNADDLINTAKQRAENSVIELEGQVKEIIDSNITKIDSILSTQANAVVAPFRAPLNTFKRDINAFSIELIKVEAAIKTMKLSDALTVAQQVEGLVKSAVDLKDQANAIYTQMKAEIIALPSVAQQTKTALTEQTTDMITQLTQLSEGYLVEIQNTLKAFDMAGLSDLSETAAEFSESTFALPFSSIPGEVVIDIRRVGERKPGDQLFFKATISDNVSDNQFDKTLYWAKYTMFHIGLHNSIRASLIFADKINGDFANSSNDFQLAPSYSVIFKVGRRKGMFYNKYLTPGLGINVSTLDFDNNSRPEIGIGLTAAFFKDYLQVGYGINMSTDDSFWMFGLRLPLFGWATGVETSTGSAPVSN